MSRKPDSSNKIKNETCLTSDKDILTPRNIVYDSSLENNLESSYISEKKQPTPKDEVPIASEAKEEYFSPVRLPSFRSIDIRYMPELQIDDQLSEKYNMLNSPTKHHVCSNVETDVTFSYKEMSFNSSEEVTLDIEPILTHSYISHHSPSSEEITLDLEPISHYSKLPRQSTIINIATQSSFIDIKGVSSLHKDDAPLSPSDISCGSLASKILHIPSCEVLSHSCDIHECDQFLSASNRSDMMHVSFPYGDESGINSQVKGDEDEMPAFLKKENSASQVAVKSAPMSPDNRPQPTEWVFPLNGSSTSKLDYIWILLILLVTLGLILTAILLPQRPYKHEVKLINGDLTNPTFGYNEAKQVWSVWKMANLAFCFAEERIHPLGGPLNKTESPMNNFTELINEDGNPTNSKTEEEHEKFIGCIIDLLEKEDLQNQSHIHDYKRLMYCIERNFGRNALLDMTGDAGKSCLHK